MESDQKRQRPEEINKYAVPELCETCREYHLLYPQTCLLCSAKLTNWMLVLSGQEPLKYST